MGTASPPLLVAPHFPLAYTASDTPLTLTPELAMSRRTNLRVESLEARETPSANRLFATAQDFGSRVFVYEATGPIQLPNGALIFGSSSGRLIAAFDAYPAPFAGGVHLAIGDVTGDNIEDVVTSPASGGGPHIKVFDGASLLAGRAVVVREFVAFDPLFFGGTYLAVGQIDPSNLAQEIVVGAGLGGGPHVRVFRLNSAGPIRDFFAFDPNFRGGVRVAAGDFNGDGRADVAIGAGPGALPLVRALDLSQGQPRQLDQFLAYDAAFRGGVYVAAGELEGHSGLADIATGAGEGGGPHVRIWSFNGVGSPARMVRNFFAGDPTNRAGVRVSVGNLGQVPNRRTLYVGDGSGPRGNQLGLNNADPRLRAYDLRLFTTVVISGSNGPQFFDDFVESGLDLFDGFRLTRFGGLNLG
jgi:FG-GAP repeat